MKRMTKVLLVLVLALGLAFPATGLAATDATGANAKEEYLVQFNSEGVERGLLRAFGVQDTEILHTFELLPVVLVELTENQHRGLSNHPGIKAIERNKEVHLAQTITWGLHPIQAIVAQSAGYSGKGLKVAILDTGIDNTHEDLWANVSPFGHSVFGDPANINPFFDGNGHGTHVAGTVAAMNNTIGVLGVAPRAELFAVKVLNNAGSGTYAGIAQGIEWSVRMGVNIINMSLGGSSHDPILEQWVNIAYNRGILVVAAAGNSGNSAGIGDNVMYPARYANAIAVAATDPNNVRAWFSSTGPAVELSAPGVNVLSTLPGNNYGSLNGTSMASPHVAGAAAVVWEAKPWLTNVDLRKLLQITALPLGNPNHYGFGLVRIMDAINY